jgi:hypothetical protein
MLRRYQMPNKAAGQTIVHVAGRLKDNAVSQETNYPIIFIYFYKSSRFSGYPFCVLNFFWFLLIQENKDQYHLGMSDSRMDISRCDGLQPSVQAGVNYTT